MFGRIVLAAFVVVLGASAASSATLQDVRGRVLLNRGAGFIPVSAPTTVQPGERIMTAGNATVRLVYGPNCAVSIPGGRTIVVSAQYPCAGGLQANSRTPWLVAGTLGVGGLFALLAEASKSDDNPPPPVIPVSP